MRKLLLFSLLFPFFFACGEKSSHKNPDFGMSRRLPPMPPMQDEPRETNPRNILKVHINNFDKLLINDKPIEIILLKDEVKTFISNPNNDSDKPEKEIKTIDLLGQMAVSKGIISLQNDRGTSYQMYMAVQNELMKAYAELRDEFAMVHFHTAYSKLQEKEQEAVREFYPLSISEAEPNETKNKKNPKDETQ
jgi:biopolymer transport protein ExbD